MKTSAARLICRGDPTHTGGTMANGGRRTLMGWRAGVVAVGASLAVGAAGDGAVLFRDTFKGKLGEGWKWVREDAKRWRVGDRGLEVCIHPGNMWGPANDAKNVLVRRVPDAGGKPLEV